MIKDVMVHLDATVADEVRLACAEALAVRFGAHLTGLYLNVIPTPPVGLDGGMAAAAAISELEEEARAEGDIAERRLVERLGRIASPQELRRFDVLEGVAGEAAAQEARWADLFVALRPYRADKDPRSPEIFEHVLFGGGRSVIAVPDDGGCGSAPTVVIGWNGSREAARAVAEAMPFLKAARKVCIACIGPEGPGATHQEPGADIARHLDRHGIAVTVRDVLSRVRDAADALLDEVESQEAGLLVMGGYGHSRLREWALGGVTRAVLTRAPVPVLLAH